jgi:hypothetical protein
MKIALEALSAFSGLLAAGFWFASALGDVSPPGVGWGGVISPNDPFFKAFSNAMKRNRWGAGFAGISALCAAGTAVMDILSR